MLIACLAKICYIFPPLHRDDHNISTVDREDRMRKVEIVNRIAEETGLTKVKAEEAVDAILEEVKGVLQQGESVILRRFGSFQVREKRARLGRNPKTGEEAGIPARRVVRFKSGKYFRAAVDGESE
jgi:nucleoid DNA-binding protein